MRTPNDYDMALAWGVPDLPAVRDWCDRARKARPSRAPARHVCVVCGRMFVPPGKRSHTQKRKTCGPACYRLASGRKHL